MKSIVADSERDILTEFSAELKRQIRQLESIIPDANTRLFYATFVFIDHNRELFSSICSDMNNQSILCQMVELVYPKLEIVWLPKGSPAPALGSERTDMLIRILVEIICKWSTATGCNVRKSDRYIQRLLRAVGDAAAKRLP